MVKKLTLMILINGGLNTKGYYLAQALNRRGVSSELVLIRGVFT